VTHRASCLIILTIINSKNYTFIWRHIWTYRVAKTHRMKLQVIFRTRATNYGALLQKMTHKDKASYDFTSPCTYDVTYEHIACGHAAKEPQIIGLFCAKWPIKIRHHMGLRHPVWTHHVRTWLLKIMVGSLKSWFSFAKEPYKRDDILRTHHVRTCRKWAYHNWKITNLYFYVYHISYRKWACHIWKYVKYRNMWYWLQSSVCVCALVCERVLVCVCVCVCVCERERESVCVCVCVCVCVGVWMYVW